MRSSMNPLTPGANPKGRASRFVKGTAIPKPPNTDGSGIAALFVHPLSVLLLCLPLGLLAAYFQWGAVWVFWFNFFAMVPLAKIMGDATEELAAGLKNDMIAGLLNATFGNAVEMVITVNTLRLGMFSVVKSTLLGSVLSNLLLVLGMSFFFGGIVGKSKGNGHQALGDGTGSMATESMGVTSANFGADKEQSTQFVGEKVQTFSVMSALVNTSMLLLSCLSFSLVTVFHSVTNKDGDSSLLDEVMLPVSRICAIIITVAYCAYIFFQLVTHSTAMAEDEGDDDEEAEEPKISIMASTALLFLTTLVVAVSSYLVVDAIEGVTEHAGVGEHFIGIVLLPIVGNACEHASAIRFAMMDKPGLSIGIAVGSSTQISLFVVPFSVLCGWCIGQPMDLDFGALNTTVMTLSVIVVLSIVVDGSANWLQGYLLVSAYMVVAVLYWFLPNEVEI